MKITFVTSFDESNACVRLQSGAVARGAAPLAELHCRVIHPGGHGKRALSEEDCIGFHYNDLPAIESLRRLGQASRLPTTVCFGSDIYGYERYIGLQDIADLFMVPTERHRRVLMAQISTPIFTLSEAIDPIALSPDPAWVFPIRTGKRVGWFGYSESFYKGMHSVLRTIQAAQQARTIDEFSLVVDMHRFPNDLGLRLSPYNISSFRDDFQRFDYAILSHFPLDLTVNSLIKSPNKLVTALMIGCIPLVSDTGSYRDTMEQIGLERFIFGSPRELSRLLARLDPSADSALVRSTGAIDKLRASLGDVEVARQFIAKLKLYEAIPLAERDHRELDQPQSCTEFLRERVSLASRLRRFSKRRFKRST